MSIRSISTLFLSAPGSFCALTPEVPVFLAEVISSTSCKACAKCGAFLLQAENLCPVCCPVASSLIQSRTCFNVFKIARPEPPPGLRPYVFLLDVDVRRDRLISFARLLTDEARRFPDFGAAPCYIGFVSQSVVFCKFSPNQLRFCFVPSIEQVQTCERPMAAHVDCLIVAATHAKTVLWATPEKGAPLSALFKFLTDMCALNGILDVIYVLSGDLVNFDYASSPRLHLIQIASEPSEKNIQFALRANATYSLIPQINESTLRSFKLCIAPSIISTQIVLFTSAGWSFKAAYEPIRAISKKDNELAKSTTIDLKFFSHAIPPVIILRSDREAGECVSVQIIIEIFDAHLLVMNGVWKRANGPAEWGASLDYAWYMAQFAQLRAAEALKDLGIATPWSVVEGRLKFPKEAAVYKKKAETPESGLSFANGLEGSKKDLVRNLHPLNMYSRSFAMSPSIVRSLHFLPNNADHPLKAARKLENHCSARGDQSSDRLCSPSHFQSQSSPKHSFNSIMN
jgi:hypothetical protein